jgi:carbonic anhydrase/acetyltransferase-like protein (isoleucine patch superfamily)
VRLQREASVWFGAVVRGDNEWIELGERSQIQDNATLHTDPGFPLTIGSNCVIGHNVILHGCTIGDNSLVGMGAIMLNGAKVGQNCLVGAGAAITGSVTVGDDVWIGPHATIASEITIGDGAYVTLGSVVTRDVAAGQRVTGNFAIDHDKFIAFLRTIR